MGVHMLVQSEPFFNLPVNSTRVKERGVCVLVTKKWRRRRAVKQSESLRELAAHGEQSHMVESRVRFGKCGGNRVGIDIAVAKAPN